MTKEYPLIQVGEHWYLIDKEAEVLYDEWCFEIHEEYNSNNPRIPDSNPNYSWWLRRLNMHYLKEAPKEFGFWRKMDGSVWKVLASTDLALGLPLIPAFEDNISESEIEQIAADLGYCMLPDDLREGIIAGYKANKAKWTDEHMKTMFRLGAANHANGKPSFEEALQSLTKKPVALVVEMVDNGYEVDMEGRGGEDIGWMSVWEPEIWDGYIVIKEVKYDK